MVARSPSTRRIIARQVYLRVHSIRSLQKFANFIYDPFLPIYFTPKSSSDIYN